MKMIQPSWDILNRSTFEDASKFIERIARTCYKSEDMMKPGSADKLVSNLVKSNHLAMIEHVNITVRFICNRGFSHELVRHKQYCAA